MARRKINSTKPLKTLVTKVESKYKALGRIINKKYGKGVAPKITTDYCLDSIRALGTHIKRNGIHTIELNPALLNELKDDYINDVVVHEYAHAVVSEIFGKFHNGRRVMPHGKEFKQICYMFGIDGKSTTKIAHNSKIFNDTKKKTGHPYHCDCMDHNLSTIKHNRIRRGSKYTCTNCKKPLVYGEFKSDDKKTTPSTPTKKVGKGQYVYHCSCTEYHLTSIRHNRARKGTNYTCKLCKEKLVFGKMPKAATAA